MAKWQDKTIDKPKEPYKQKLPFVSLYNEYGFDYNNEMYSIPEENRDFRKKIQYEIIMEELKTQNILGQHITDEADRTIGEVNEHTDVKTVEIKNHVTDKTNYVINTLSPKIETVDTKVNNVKTTVESNQSIIANIWNKIKTLNFNK